ncbi:MAG: hypothetical protein E7464_04620 [Ruminococcaceae bacterium]|nr:hypothetical protein [Oscillospiraceae bacterium]
MNNTIICEYCGTLYNPEEGRCPICQGQPGNSNNYMGDHYDYDERPMEEEAHERRPIGGKIAALIALILLFVGFTGYILYSFELLPFLKPAVEEEVLQNIPCTQLAVDAAELTLEEAGASIQLQTAVEPANTTDQIIFSVDDSTIASVTQDGTITAKAPGETTVAIMCGKYTAYCTVICSFEADDPEPEPEPEPDPDPGVPAPGADPLSISAEDISFFEKTENTMLVLTGGDGSIPEWESSDEAVVRVDETGYVEAVGGGTATVTATVGSESVSCIVRCQFE